MVQKGKSILVKQWREGGCLEAKVAADGGARPLVQSETGSCGQIEGKMRKEHGTERHLGEAGDRGEGARKARMPLVVGCGLGFKAKQDIVGRL